MVHGRTLKCQVIFVYQMLSHEKQNKIAMKFDLFLQWILKWKLIFENSFLAICKKTETVTYCSSVTCSFLKLKVIQEPNFINEIKKEKKTMFTLTFL